MYVSILTRSFVLYSLGWFSKNKNVIFFGTSPHFVYFGNKKSYLQNMKKIEKSLGGATRPQSFVHKVNGIFG